MSAGGKFFDAGYRAGYAEGKADAQREALLAFWCVVYAANAEHAVVVPPIVAVSAPGGRLTTMPQPDGSTRYEAEL